MLKANACFSSSVHTKSRKIFFYFVQVCHIKINYLQIIIQNFVLRLSNDIHAYTRYFLLCTSLIHTPNVTFPYECIIINIPKWIYCMTYCILRNNLFSYYKIMSALHYYKDIFPCKQTISCYLHWRNILELIRYIQNNEKIYLYG